MNFAVFYPASSFSDYSADSDQIERVKSLIGVANIPPVEGESKHDEFMRLIRDPSIHAIIAWRGGIVEGEDTHNSSIELVESLSDSDWNEIRNSNTIVVGLSDVSYLLNAMQSKGIICYYGPNIQSSIIKTEDDSTNETTIDYLLGVLSGRIKHIDFSDTRLTVGQYNPFTVCGGEAAGILIGGNLNTTYEYVKRFGNPFSAVEGHTILFLEEVDPYYGKWRYPAVNPPTVETMINLLKNEKIFESVAGLIIGRSKEPHAIDPEDGVFPPRINNESELILLDSLMAELNLKDIPVLANVASGHLPPVVTMPLGRKIRLNADEKTIDFN